MIKQLSGLNHFRFEENKKKRHCDEFGILAKTNVDRFRLLFSFF